MHEDLFEKSNTDKLLQNYNDLSKLSNLKNILKLLIKNEEYESAALIKNKIDQLDDD